MQMKNKHKSGTVFFSLLSMIAQKNRLILILNYLFAFLDGTLSACAIIYIQKMFDTISGLSQKQTDMQTVIQTILLFIIIKVGGELANGFYNALGEIHADITAKNLGSRINAKLGRIAAVNYEQSETLDYINKAYNGAGNGRNYVNSILTIFFLYVPYYVILCHFIYRTRPILALVVVLIFLPGTLAQITKAKIFKSMEEAIAPARRQTEYYSACISSREAFAETRMTGSFPYFRQLLENSLLAFNSIRVKAHHRAARKDLVIESYSLIAYCLIIMLLFYELVTGQISLGMFSALFISLGNIFDMTNEVINEAVSNHAKLSGKIENFMHFLNLGDKKEGALPLSTHGEIQLSHVSFTYPNGECRALNDISLTIHDHETIAVVGANGSGKTTLSRVISGIYLPDEGTVLHHGHPTDAYTKEALYTLTSGVFQKFGRYKITLKENVVISDTAQEPDATGIEKALYQSGIGVDKNIFEKGLDTMLANEFGGVDLSGGQWQKVAIARGLYRDHELLILDEPTSSIDPIEEKKILTEFMNMSQNKTSVIITHRLASAKEADRIVVMDKGSMIDIGSHAELLDRCSLYRTMWNAQAGQYV